MVPRENIPGHEIPHCVRKIIREASRVPMLILMKGREKGSQRIIVRRNFRSVKGPESGFSFFLFDQS